MVSAGSVGNETTYDVPTSAVAEPDTPHIHNLHFISINHPAINFPTPLSILPGFFKLKFY